MEEAGVGGGTLGAVRVAPEDEQGGGVGSRGLVALRVADAEQGLVAVAVEDGEADDVAVEGDGLVEVGDAKRGAADAGSGRQVVAGGAVGGWSVDMSPPRSARAFNASIPPDRPLE